MKRLAIDKHRAAYVAEALEVAAKACRELHAGHVGFGGTVPLGTPTAITALRMAEQLARRFRRDLEAAIRADIRAATEDE